MLIWAVDQVVFDEEDWRQTCAFACSSCLLDFSSCDVDEFNLASLVLSSVRKLWNKRFKHVSMVFERTGEKIYKHIFTKVAETWFLSSSSWQLFSARASSCRRLPSSRWSSSFCNRKRGQRWVKSRRDKSKGAKIGKIADERPLVKWSEAFNIFQSGQA